MEVRLEARGGTFNPAEVTTDDAGEATAEFKADNTPGKYNQPFEFEFRYPFFDILSGSSGNQKNIVNHALLFIWQDIYFLLLTFICQL